LNRAIWGAITCLRSVDQCLFVRPPPRLALARDDVDLRRVFVVLREERILRMRDFTFAARREPLFFTALRDLATDFLAGRRLGPGLEIALASLTTRRTVRLASGPSGRFSAAFPAMAPATPPTIAPIGPATLPITAPATAPAVSFGIGGIWIFSDDCGVSFFCGSGLLGITTAFLNIFDLSSKILRMPQWLQL
jgi:hypothetical protein